MMKASACAILAVSFIVSTPSFAAENFPERPVRLIVPFNQGGSTGNTAQFYKTVIEENDLLPQPVVVNFMPGASGSVGTRAVKDAEPDGYTILTTHIGVNGAKALGNVDFGSEAFEPIAGTGRFCNVFLVGEQTPYQTLEEALQAAKDAPDTILMGAALGGITHMGGLVAEEALPGAAFRYVQYTGTGAIYPALLGGHIAGTVLSSSAYLNTGGVGLRALGYMSDERHPQMPDVPTFKELGYDAEFCIHGWWFAPKDTPAEVVNVLATALEKATQHPQMIELMEKQSVEPVFLRGEELHMAIAREAEAIEQITAKLQGAAQ